MNNYELTIFTDGSARVYDSDAKPGTLTGSDPKWSWSPVRARIVAPGAVVLQYLQTHEGATKEQAIRSWFSSLVHAGQGNRALCGMDAPSGTPGMRITCPVCLESLEFYGKAPTVQPTSTPTEERMWRTPISISRVTTVALSVRIPAWHNRQTVRVPKEALPQEVWQRAENGQKRFHARVNIGASSVEQLRIEQWELE